MSEEKNSWGGSIQHGQVVVTWLDFPLSFIWLVGIPHHHRFDLSEQVLQVPRKDADGGGGGGGAESERVGEGGAGGEATTLPNVSLNVSIRSSSSNSNINDVGGGSNGGFSSPTAERPNEHGINTTTTRRLLFFLRRRRHDL